MFQTLYLWGLGRGVGGGAVFEQLAGMDEQLISLLVLACAQEQARLCNGVQSSRKRGKKRCTVAAFRLVGSLLKQVTAIVRGPASTPSVILKRGSRRRLMRT